MNTILTDVIPAAARKYVYAALFLASVVYGAYQAYDGDWTQVVGAVLAALGFGTATSNTDVQA
jgi:hypothetical protein